MTPFLSFYVGQIGWPRKAWCNFIEFMSDTAVMLGKCN